MDGLRISQLVRARSARRCIADLVVVIATTTGYQTHKGRESFCNGRKSDGATPREEGWIVKLCC